MPQLSISASSTRFGVVPQQRLAFIVSSNLRSMLESDPNRYRSCLRRIRHQFRRPDVATIADIFISSLVLAGFCKKHSLRCNGTSAVSGLSTDKRPWSLLNRTVVDTRCLPARRPPDCSKLSMVYFGRISTRTARMYSTENQSNSGDCSSDCNREEKLSTQRVEGEAILASGESLTGYDEGETEDSNADIVQAPGEKENIHIQDSSTKGSFHPTSPDTKKKGRSRPRLAAQKAETLAEFFGKTLGMDTNWERALDAMIDEPNDSIIRYNLSGRSQDMVEYQKVRELLAALSDQTKSNQYVFRLYRELPSPGVSYLSKNTRGELLRRFGDPPDRRRAHARRFLALVDDMIAADLPLSRSLWTTAIYFTVRVVGRVYKEDLRNAIGLWRRMERVAGISSDSVVFEVLFDISLKAGQYVVADRLMEEMESRGLKFLRHGKVCNIYYQGLLHNVDGIHQAFDDFVKSGQIVDTIVLNCLLASFLRAGEVEPAAQLYKRMMMAQMKLEKEFPNGYQHILHYPSLSTEYIHYRRRNKKFGWVLKISALLQHRFPEYHRMLQASLPMTPDTKTFHVLLAHHAYETGDLSEFMTIVKDMERTYRIPPRAMVYLFLFDGFARHGRRRKEWTPQRLIDIWGACRRALFESKARLNQREHLQRNIGWENPLAKSDQPMMEPIVDDLYTPLPSGHTPTDQIEGDTLEDKEDSELMEEKEEIQQEWDEDVDKDMADRMFRSAEPDGMAYQRELEDIQRRIENGVFLSRRMIMAILRAFGTCCEPQDLLDVWLQIEPIWQVEERRMVDVMAVKEEFDRQMQKSERLCKQR